MTSLDFPRVHHHFIINSHFFFVFNVGHSMAVIRKRAPRIEESLNRALWPDSACAALPHAEMSEGHSLRYT